MSRDPYSEANDPFSSQYNAPAQRSVMRPPAPPSGTPWLKIFCVIGVLSMLLCGGLLGASYLALQSVIAPPTLDLPTRPATTADAFRTDADAFNASLAKAATNPKVPKSSEIPESIRTFIDETVESGLMDGPVAFDEPHFIAAINDSPDLGSPLDFLDRIAISSWLDEYVPVPSKLDDYHRIVAVELSADSKLATVSLIFYSEENQADSQRWFLVADDAGWKVYDWMCLEYGRRMSDEYASYLRGRDEIAPGYDLAMEKINDAFDAYDSDGVDAAIAVLQQAESTPMLNRDRDVARLRFAYAFMELQRYDLAKRSLQQIQSPDRMWGVYPVMAICHFNLDEMELAMESAKKAESQSPDHPRTHWLMSTLLEEMGQTEEAADRAVLALAGCPRDQTLVSRVTANRRPRDIPALIRAADVDQPYAFAMLADTAAYDATWATAMIDAARSNPDSIAMPAGFMELLLGNHAWAMNDFDSAAKHFLAARNTAVDTDIRDTAYSDHVNCRIEDDRYAELLDESDDLLDTVSTLATMVFEGEFFGDPGKLLQAIEANRSSPKTRASNEASADSSADSSAESSLDSPSELDQWARGITGWCRHATGDDKSASADLIEFVRWRQTSSQARSGDEYDDAYGYEYDDARWLDEGAHTALAESMLNIGDIDGLLAILPDNTPVQTLVMERLRRDGIDACQRFLDANQSSTAAMTQVLCARLRAAVESFAANSKSADDWHAKAHELASQLDSEETEDFIRSLTIDRARDLVWNRVPPGEVELPADDEQAQNLIVDVVADAVVLQDADLVQAWTQFAETNVIDTEQRAVIDRERYQWLIVQGRYDDAAELFRTVDPNDTDDSAAVKHELRQSALLKSRRFADVLADAKRIADAAGESPDAETSLRSSPVAAAQALVALVSSDAESLNAILWERDADDVANWLGYVVPDEFLEANVDDPAIASTLHRYPSAVGYRPAQASGHLLVQEKRTLSPDFVNQSLATTFGESFEVTEINATTASDDVAAWLATSSSGDRFLINVQPGTLSPAGLPSAMQSLADVPIQRLTIEVVDHSPLPQQRMFEAAHGLAEAIAGDAIAFHWTDRLLTWFHSTAKPLGEQLRWIDRVPVSHQTIRRALVFRNKETDSDKDYRFTDYWDGKLQEAGEPIAVTMMIQTGSTTETIPSMLIDVDQDGYMLLIEPKIDSQLNPQVDAGFPCKVGSLYVRQVDQQ